MKKLILGSFLAAGCALASAQGGSNFSIGVAAVNGGFVSPGFGIYTPKFEAGLDGSLAHFSGINTLSLTGWGGLRRSMSNNFFMSLGVSLSASFSSILDNPYSISPYIGFDVVNVASSPILLGAWINPVSWNNVSGSTDTLWVFGSGGIKVAYLF